MLCVGPDGKLCQDRNTQLGKSLFKKAGKSVTQATRKVARQVVGGAKTVAKTAVRLTPTYFVAQGAKLLAAKVKGGFDIARMKQKAKVEAAKEKYQGGADAGAPEGGYAGESVDDNPASPMPMTATAPAPSPMPGSEEEGEEAGGASSYGTMPVSPEEFFGPAPEYMNQEEEGEAAPESSVMDGTCGSFIVERASPAEHARIARRLPLYQPPANGRIRQNVSKALRSRMNPRSWSSALGGG